MYGMLHTPPAEETQPAAGRELVVGAGEVRFDKATSRAPVLSELDFVSGGRKTTIFNLLLRFWRPERGAILIDGQSIAVTVCHLPPGTSKWNKIEHRLFAFITKNWRGKPLLSHRAIVQLIGATTTRKGLQVRAELDTNTYPAGIKVSDAEMATLAIERHAFHGEWNYTLRPR